MSEEVRVSGLVRAGLFRHIFPVLDMSGKLHLPSFRKYLSLTGTHVCHCGWEEEDPGNPKKGDIYPEKAVHCSAADKHV